MSQASSFIVSWIRYASHYSLCYFIKHSWETQICLLAQTYEKWPQRSFRASEGGNYYQTQFDSPDVVFELIRHDKNYVTPIAGSELFHFSVFCVSIIIPEFQLFLVWENAPKHPFFHVWLTSPPCTWPVSEQLTRLQYPASGRVCTYQSLNYTKKYEAQALLSKNNRSGNLIVQYAVAVLSPWHHWTSGSRRKQIPSHLLPQPLLSATDSFWCIMFCVINTIHFVWWQALFEHGPVNVYGAAEESKECCNNPPKPVRCNQPFWSANVLQKQTHEASLSLSHK